MEKTSWDHETIGALFDLPFFKLVNKAYLVHQQHAGNQSMEFCTLSSIKTGACPEDCAYCPQSGRYKTGVKKENLLSLEAVLAQAKQAKANGAQRFCMGAAWKNPPAKDFPKVLDMVREVKNIGLETCMTLGKLDAEGAKQLKAAGLDFYNHNLDTSESFYPSIITTRTYQDRLTTIQHVIDADINVCCGGILGMGETREDRVQFLLALYHLPVTPKSIPINQLIPIKGTPLGNTTPLDPFEFIRTIAITRLIFPITKIRLSAGRENMSDEMQAWCFMAGANSIFIGDKLLTSKNPDQSHDVQLLKKLGMPFPQTISEDAPCG